MNERQYLSWAPKEWLAEEASPGREDSLDSMEVQVCAKFGDQPRWEEGHRMQRCGLYLSLNDFHMDVNISARDRGDPPKGSGRGD